MQALRLRAKITKLAELDRIATPYTSRTWSIEEEQQSLKATRKKVERQWDMAQAALHGIWSKSGHTVLSSANQSPENAAASENADMPGDSVQISTHRATTGLGIHASSIKPTTTSSAAMATASTIKRKPVGSS
jgi:hypothetical protein